ncbi:hypothetical protein [Rubellicoccus peritrichatus]|uniref:Uncharacterized protein n=1 Tax=Rubellicoccus peritrichatus TaxID=3080537 RepID=A0AAQ3LBD4_9BACT|nr:hypothetical protein [Puniceicoccus sp. CR14]WOO41212.1 hypothetical protein RZN69_21535 [Puniceicoccus sp. CR14]
MKNWIINTLQWIREIMGFSLIDTSNGQRILRQISRTGEFDFTDETKKPKH